jgi:hypothetical protein
MKAPTKSLSVAFPAVLVTLFAAGGLVGRALDLPLPAAAVGLALVLLGLRIGVTVAAVVEEPAATPARPVGRGTAVRNEPSLRAANG